MLTMDAIRKYLAIHSPLVSHSTPPYQKNYKFYVLISGKHPKNIPKNVRLAETSPTPAIKRQKNTLSPSGGCTIYGKQRMKKPRGTVRSHSIKVQLRPNRMWQNSASGFPAQNMRSQRRFPASRSCKKLSWF